MYRFLLLCLALLFLFSCGGAVGGNNGVPTLTNTTVSGTLVTTTNVKIGYFYPSSASSLGFGTSPGDATNPLVYKEDMLTTGHFTPVGTTTISGGAYSINLPILPYVSTTQIFVIAWVDTNGDGIFDLGTEPGYFPVKSISSTAGVVDWFSIAYYNQQPGYMNVANYRSAAYHNDDLENIGHSGFNFTF
jgi:hypothetical protein